VKRALLTGVIALLVAGCGGKGDTAAMEPDTSLPLTAEARVYWLQDGKVWPALREVGSEDDAYGLLRELLVGPTNQEEADLGFTTAIPAAIDLEGVTIKVEDAVARVTLSAELPEEALAQVVYTLSQIPSVKSVEIEGETYTRADFEDQTPAIMVESPLPFEEVESPLRVTGTANTFEANFQYELTDTDGLIVDQNFVTATSGTGTRGTFDFTTEPYTVPFDGVGALIVFESSAKDGSRINLVEIPLRMRR
jgi:hypothetical protein